MGRFPKAGRLTTWHWSFRSATVTRAPFIMLFESNGPSYRNGVAATRLLSCLHLLCLTPVYARVKVCCVATTQFKFFFSFCFDAVRLYASETGCSDKSLTRTSHETRAGLVRSSRFPSRISGTFFFSGRSQMQRDKKKRKEKVYFFAETR